MVALEHPETENKRMNKRYKKTHIRVGTSLPPSSVFWLIPWEIGIWAMLTWAGSETNSGGGTNITLSLSSVSGTTGAGGGLDFGGLPLLRLTTGSSGFGRGCFCWRTGLFFTAGLGEVDTTGGVLASSIGSIDTLTTSTTGGSIPVLGDITIAADGTLVGLPRFLFDGKMETGTLGTVTGGTVASFGLGSIPSRPLHSGLKSKAFSLAFEYELWLSILLSRVTRVL